MSNLSQMRLQQLLLSSRSLRDKVVRNQISMEFCFYCGKRLSVKNTTRDHKRPLSKGGSTSDYNIVMSCRGCNQDKGSISYEEFRVVLAFRAGVISTPAFKFAGENVQPSTTASRRRE